MATELPKIEFECLFSLPKSTLEIIKLVVTNENNFFLMFIRQYEIIKIPGMAFS